MTEVVVTITFVSEAMSKMVSGVMGSRVGSSERSPKALRYTTCPLCPMRHTKPGARCRATASCRTESSDAKFAVLADWAKVRLADTSKKTIAKVRHSLGLRRNSRMRKYKRGYQFMRNDATAQATLG